MRHFASPSFWEAYAKLPENIRGLADKSYALLKEDPRHPSLRLKKIGRFWSVRVGSQRIFASEALEANMRARCGKGVVTSNRRNSDKDIDGGVFPRSGQRLTRNERRGLQE